MAAAARVCARGRALGCGRTWVRSSRPVGGRRARGSSGSLSQAAAAAAAAVAAAAAAAAAQFRTISDGRGGRV